MTETFNGLLYDPENATPECMDIFHAFGMADRHAGMTFETAQARAKTIKQDLFRYNDYRNCYLAGWHAKDDTPEEYNEYLVSMGLAE